MTRATVAGNPTLQEALRLRDAGISVIPIGDNKRPAGWALPRHPDDETKGTWDPYKERLPTRDEVIRWFGGARRKHGIGRIHGVVSGNLETFDFDIEPEVVGLEHEAVVAEWEAIVEYLSPGLLLRLTKIRTPRPGTQYCYRCAAPVESNQKLAFAAVLDENGKPALLTSGGVNWKAIVETRGEGGYACGPGTPAHLHPKKREYEHVGGPPLHQVETITAEERLILLNAARMLTRKQEEPDEPRHHQGNGAGDRPGDDFNARTTWDEILRGYGWTKIAESGGVGKWKRPGGTSQWSATTNYGGHDLLHVFSTGLPIPAERSYNRFQFVTYMDHGGDFSAAAKALTARGYGKPPDQNGIKEGARVQQAPEPRRREPRKRDPEVEWRRFPVEALPAGVAEYVSACAEAIGCDSAYIALPLLACLARAVGNKRTIRLKRTWEEPAIIWGCIVGKSGTHKTPAIQAATRHLQQKQAESISRYQEAMAKYEQDKAVYERDFAEWKRKKNNTDPPPWEPDEPVCERFITTDCTIEALADRLSTQFDGLLVVRDELAGWLGGIAEYKGGKGSDLGHWLAMWSGAPLIVDRKTGAKKFLHVPRAAVSLVGGIQPGVLRAAIGREHMQDGLCARLLLVMPPPRRVKWSEAIVDPVAEKTMGHIFDRLLALQPAADPEGNPAPYTVPLSAEAKAIWVPYYNRHRAELALLDDDLAAAWSKLEAYTARFALMFSLCDGSDEAIDRRSMEAAIALSDWFGVEAKRVYGLFAEDEEQREQRELVELIQRRGGRITPRELVQSSRRYGSVDAAEKALSDLEQAEFGSFQVTPTATKPRRDFVLFPSTNLRGTSDPGEFVCVDNVDSSETHPADDPESEWGEV